jgi:hypothetical protein
VPETLVFETAKPKPIKQKSRERISNYIANGTLRTTQPGGKSTPHIISEADYLEFEAWYQENILKQK